MLPPLFLWHIFLITGNPPGGVSVDEVSKRAHRQPSTSLGLESGNEDNRQQAGCQEDEISHKQQISLKLRSVTLAMTEFGRDVQQRNRCMK